MEKILGKDRAHKIIRDAFYNDMTDMVKEELEEKGPVNKFARAVSTIQAGGYCLYGKTVDV